MPRVERAGNKDNDARTYMRDLRVCIIPGVRHSDSLHAVTALCDNFIKWHNCGCGKGRRG